MSELTFKGMPAKVVVELEGRHATIRVPVDGVTVTFEPKDAGYGVLHLPIGQPLMESINFARNEALSKGIN